jgi:hypothetical protein
VNHWILARQLEEKGLLDPKLTEEIHKVVIAVISTPGGLEYWEYDAKAAPTRLLSEHSPSSGYASSIDAGKLAHRMTNPGILELYKNADRPCSKQQKLLD